MAAAILVLDLFHRKRKKCSQKQLKREQNTGMMTKIQSSNLANKCRICLSDGEIGIFTEYAEENIARSIELLTQIKISREDDLPKSLCTSCYSLLQSAVLFRHMALETNEKLRSIPETRREDKKSQREDFNDWDIEDPKTKVSYQEADAHDEIDNHEWEDTGMSNEPEKYNCKKCDLEYTDSNKYLSHLKTPEHNARKTKPAVKRATCVICRSSMVAGYLATHMIRKHSDLKPFVCEVCGKGFPALSSLKTHSRIHSDELPFKCKECPYRGRFKYSLRLHMRVHTGEKPYSCHLCSTQFSFQTNFNKHMKSHNTDYDFKCEQCDRGFHSQKQMTDHVKIVHSGIKEHKCDICGKHFAYRKLMTKHTRVVHKIKKNSYKGRAPLYLQMEKQKLQDKDNMNS